MSEAPHADDIYLGHFCLANTPPPARWKAVAAAGFRGVSVLWREIRARQASGVSIADLKAELDAHGLRAIQMELVSLPKREDLPAFLEEAAAVAEASAALGCAFVTVIAYGLEVPFDDMVTGLAEVCDVFAGYGIVSAMEFVPHLTSIPDLATASRLVAAADRPNAGIILDTLHFNRCGADWAALEALDGRLITAVQVNDGPRDRPTEGYMDECNDHRRPPGAGDFQVARFLSIVRGKTRSAPLTVEVTNFDRIAGDAQRAAAMLAEAFRRQLALAG